MDMLWILASLSSDMFVVCVKTVHMALSGGGQGGVRIVLSFWFTLVSHMYFWKCLTTSWRTYFNHHLPEVKY